MPTEKQEQIALRIPASMRVALEKRAKGRSKKAQAQITMSDVIRSYIRKGLSGDPV
jgi:hypothetical protein